jgi:hypothetical protein
MSASTTEREQKKLKKFLDRRHPAYMEMLPHWEFLEACYEGGRAWFEDNIFRYIKEGDKEFEARIERAYRFNHTREVVDLVDKYLFKIEVSRGVDSAPEPVKAFWQKSTLNGMGIRDFVRCISNRTSVFGKIWIVVDNTKSGEVKSVASEKKAGVQTYAYIVEPKHVLDMSYDEKGELNWILIHEQIRDDSDPIESSGALIDRYRLWERNQWTLFTVKREGRKTTVSVDGPHPHALGEVPVFSADCTVGHEQYDAPSLIDDVAYMDRAVSNYLSNLDAIIQDQTFSQLAIPAQGLLPGEDGHDKVIEMGTKRIFTYDGEGGKIPFYLSPDVKQAQLIIQVINKIINEIYHTVGLAGERTKEDNAQGIDNSSGVAKAYDFERVNSLLSSKADSLQLIENRLLRLVGRWNGIEVSEDLVSYPDTFDVRGLYDEFEIAARLVAIEAPDSVRREQMESVIDKMFPQLKKELKEAMLAELKSWPPKVDPLAANAPGKNALKHGNQSEVNKELVKEGA